MLQTIKDKAEKYWTAYNLHLAIINAVNLFPLQFTLKKLPINHLAESFADIKEQINTLHINSKNNNRHGYEIIYHNKIYRHFGEQNIPMAVQFLTERDFLYFISKAEEFVYYKNLIIRIKAELPQLLPWISNNIAKFTKNLYLWPKLINVVQYFIRNPQPNLYIRQLEIPDIDSKFIEQHKPILNDILSIIVCNDHIDSNIKFANNIFEKKFNLKYDQPLIRFRYLDPSIALNAEFLDCTVPLGQFNSATINCDYVFITENKINGLCFPNCPASIIIFGMGFKINLLAETPWLYHKKIIYWGDLDSYGFAILSRLREHFPQVTSFLMDEDTLLAHRKLWGIEDPDKRCSNFLPNLTDNERELYDKLRYDHYGTSIRLEQERVGYGWLCKYIEAPIIFSPVNRL